MKNAKIFFARTVFTKKSIEQKKMSGKEQFVVIVVEKNNLFFMLFSRVIQVEKINALNLGKIIEVLTGISGSKYRQHVKRSSCQL